MDIELATIIAAIVGPVSIGSLLAVWIKKGLTSVRNEIVLNTTSAIKGVVKKNSEKVKKVDGLLIGNLKQYWYFHVLHVLNGSIAGRLLMEGWEYAIVGAVIAIAYMYRQGMEFLKRKDTPGIDLAYLNGGLIVGVLSSWINWGALTELVEKF